MSGWEVVPRQESAVSADRSQAAEAARLLSPQDRKTLETQVARRSGEAAIRQYITREVNRIIASIRVESVTVYRDAIIRMRAIVAQPLPSDLDEEAVADVQALTLQFAGMEQQGLAHDLHRNNDTLAQGLSDLSRMIFSYPEHRSFIQRLVEGL